MEEGTASLGATTDASRGNGTRGNCVLGTSPTAATFVASTQWLDSGVPVVSVTGELELLTAQVLEETLLGLSDGAAGAVIVDLARCSFFDLRGLQVLLAARERLERANCPLALVCGDPNLLRVLEITRVDALFEIYPSLTAARDDHG